MNNNDDYLKLINSIENNIIEWYPFEREKRILNLSENESIQKYLISNKLIADVDAKMQYDYILFIGNFKKNEKRITESLKYLKENGKLLLAFDNSLSIKNFCKRDENDDFTKRQIEQYLEKEKFLYYKFYYVFSEIKAANVIFTDKYMMNLENKSRNISFYSDKDFILKSENDILEKLLSQDENLIKTFSNAFFIESSKNRLKDNEIKFISYSNMRKDEYKIRTIIKDSYVYKSAINNESKMHIDMVKHNIDIMKKIGIKTVDTYDDNGIISDFQTVDTLDKVIIEKFSNGNSKAAKILIKKFYEFLKIKLPKSNNNYNVFDTYNINYEYYDIENLNFTEYGFWDFIFQNAFYIDSEFVFFDQEWREKDMPIEYIMYRAIIYNSELQKYIDIQEFYNIANIDKKNIKLFDQLDKKLQLKTRSELAWNIHIKNSNPEKLNSLLSEKDSKINTLENDKKIMTNQFNELLNKKDARITFLEDNIENDWKVIKDSEFKIKTLEGKINAIENSKSWKITKPLRKIDEIVRRRNCNEDKR